MKRTYELTVVFSGQLSSDELGKSEKGVESLIKKLEGSVEKREDWGVRELAYPVSKEKKGAYRHFLLSLPPDAVKELHAALRLTQGVIRQLLVLGNN